MDARNKQGNSPPPPPMFDDDDVMSILRRKRKRESLLLHARSVLRLFLWKSKSKTCTQKTKKKLCKKLKNPKCRRKWKKKNEYYFCTLLRSEKRERERRKNARVREREREESAIAPSVFAFCLSLVYISECFTKRERDSHIYPTSDFWGIISLPNQRENKISIKPR